MTGAAALAIAATALSFGAGPEAGAAPRARPLSLLSRAERTQARLGEPFAYEIEVRHPPEEAYALRADLDAPPFRGTGAGCRRAVGGAEARTTCTMALALFDLGPHDVPEVRLAVTTPQGEATLAVPGPRVTGVGMIDPRAPPGRLRLRDPAPSVPLLVPTLRVLWWTLGVAAAVALALAGRRLAGARARAVSAPPSPPAAEVFARRLDALLARGLVERGLARELFFELSGIVREYVGAVTGVNALELTTAELVERVERAGARGIDVGALRRFGERADLVKYARAGAGPEECAAAVERARELVRRTPT